MCYPNNSIIEPATNISVFNIKLNLLTLINSKHARKVVMKQSFQITIYNAD